MSLYEALDLGKVERLDRYIVYEYTEILLIIDDGFVIQLDDAKCHAEICTISTSVW
jgi:hypothetical protein